MLLPYNVGADYDVGAALRLSGSINGQSSYFLDRTNTGGKFGSPRSAVNLMQTSRFQLSHIKRASAS